MMNILLLGSGGREHAMAWKIRQSPSCDSLFVAPGNPGVSDVATCVPIRVIDFPAIGRFCLEKQIRLIVVGPEVPLVEGLRDHFETDPSLAQVRIVGPGKAGAQLEGSKDFSKRFMMRHGIPTAAAQTFTSEQLKEALDYVAECPTPIVLKADGLAAGKGVIITSSREEAAATVRDMLENGRFGSAGSTLLVEQFLDGIELSVFVLTDGKDFVMLPEAKDYKRIGDKDTGPNTGGMGAVSPLPFADAVFMEKIRTRIIEPTIAGLHAEGIPYKGFIFFGLIRVGNDPMVIEYNARMGDPETQVVMTRLKSDFLELLTATAEGRLAGTTAEFHSHAAVVVSMVAGGYPGDYAKGTPIRLGHVKTNQVLFHAGTRMDSGQLLTDGGRVLSAVGTGSSVREARQQAYDLVSGINWDGVYFRSDIGLDVMSVG